MGMRPGPIAVLPRRDKLDCKFWSTQFPIRLSGQTSSLSRRNEFWTAAKYWDLGWNINMLNCSHLFRLRKKIDVWPRDDLRTSSPSRPQQTKRTSWSTLIQWVERRSYLDLNSLNLVRVVDMGFRIWIVSSLVLLDAERAPLANKNAKLRNFEFNSPSTRLQSPSQESRILWVSDIITSDLMVTWSW